MCVVRSHSEIREGCGLNHDGCYTVYSAPSRAKGVRGGVMVVAAPWLTKEGCVFDECSEEELEEFKNGLLQKADPMIPMESNPEASEPVE
jgi:hypothetical protein